MLVRIEKKSTTEALRHRKLRFSLSVKNRWKPGPANLSKAGAAELLAEVFAFHPDDAAHFVQTGAHAFSNAVAKCFRARCGPRWRNGAICASGGVSLAIYSVFICVVAVR